MRQGLVSGLGLHDGEALRGASPTGATPSTLSSSDAVLRRHGRSFFWARFLFGRRIAAQATRLYAFCRRVDDLADGDLPAEQSGLRLRQVRESLASGHADVPWVRDFLALAAETGMDMRAAQCLVARLEDDRGAVAIGDMRALLRYCHGVAGTVGLLMGTLLGCRSSRGDYHAVDLGIGMQLTNICRDVVEDAFRGRRYLPGTMLDDLPPQALRNPTEAEARRVRVVVAELLEQAERYYDSGLAGLAWLPLRSRFGVATAAMLYRGIGRVLQRRGCDVWRGRARVGVVMKACLTLRAVLYVLALSLRTLLRGPPDSHATVLHRGLEGLVGADPDARGDLRHEP